MTEQGLFIVLEGIDNSGKSTQSGLLKDWFDEKGLPVVQTREPGGTEVGEEIRIVLLKDRPKMISAVTQTLLFYAARGEFLTNVVWPNLLNGVNVISDRFEASTYAYQGFAQHVDTRFINDLHRYIVKHADMSPDLYIILDIPTEESIKREGNEDNLGQKLIYEKQGPQFRERLTMGYREFNLSPVGKGARVIDGMRAREEIHQEIVELVEKKLRRNKVNG